MYQEKRDRYCIEKSTTPGPICQEIASETREKHPLARMLCGELEASFLGFLIRSINAKRVLELGTFTGYSALAMAEQLPDNGELITIDKNKKIGSFSNEKWSKSAAGTKIKLLFGEAINVLDELEGTFDLIFIDADKGNYLNYLKKSLDLVSSKGIIAVDNVLWGDKVYDDTIGDETTERIREFNDFVASNENLYSTLVPIRDGLFLIKIT